MVGFAKHIILLLFTLISTLAWINLCLIETFHSILLIVLIPISILEVILMILSINYTIKPILSIIHIISSTLSEKANSNKENIKITYIKSFCANTGIIISFILSIISFTATIKNLIEPLIEKISIFQV